MARVVHTEPYAFLPQTLERGAVVASAPLLASLTRADKPFAQHAAYRDLCDVAETGGGGRRRLLLGDDGSGAFYTLVPIRPRRRGERRSLRTLPGVSLRPPLAFNPRPRRLSTPTDAFQLHPDIRLYRTALILLHRPRDAAALRAGFPRRAVRHDARRRGAVDVPGGAHSRRPRDRDAVQRARASRGGGGERVDAV